MAGETTELISRKERHTKWSMYKWHPRVLVCRKDTGLQEILNGKKKAA